MNRTHRRRLTAMVLTAAFSGNLWAVDLKALEQELDVNPVESCQEAIQLYQDGDLKGALELVSLCKDEMGQINQNIASASFKDEVMGFRAGELSQGGAMGFTQISRTYSRDGDDIEAALSSGGAGMMQMAMSFAGRKIRLGKHSATLMQDGKEITIFVPVGDGALTFTSRDVDVKTLKKFAKAFLKEFPS